MIIETGLTRVVLHLDLEDVDNGAGQLDLSVLERLVWFKVCTSAIAEHS